MPTLQRAMTSGGESRVVAARPSSLGVVPSRPIVTTVAAAAMVLAAIPVTMVEVGLEVTLAAPPLTVMVEEGRETGLLASPVGGPRGSPSWSDLEVLGEMWLGRRQNVFRRAIKLR